MRILVFMSDNRMIQKNFEIADYNSLVASINYEYCKKHNYDFIYYVPYLNSIKNIKLYNCVDPNTNTLRHCAWAKLLSTYLALDLNFDYIVYIDSDCIFKNLDKSLEDFIIPYLDYDLIFLNNKPWNNDMPCSGFYICKVCINTKKFINNWYNVNLYDKNKNHPWEQDALWTIFKDYNLKIVDSWMFKEDEHQFLRHVGIGEKDIRISYFKNFIKLNNIDYFINISYINSLYFNTANLYDDTNDIKNKTYSWQNNKITFLEYGEMNAFGYGNYLRIDQFTFNVNFGNKEHIIVFNNDYTQFISTRKNDNEIIKGIILN